MFSTIKSGALCGVMGYPVDVEVDASNGLPGFLMVGYLSNEVREAKDRVRVALKNSGIHVPALSFHVNLSPADMRKEGTAYDLPIAVGVMTVLGIVEKEQTDGLLVIGELGLAGEIKAVSGVMPIVCMAAGMGIKKCLVPADNVREALLVDEMRVMGVSNLEEVVTYLTASEELQIEMEEAWTSGRENVLEGEKIAAIPKMSVPEREEDTLDFVDIYGQEMMKRAATICAAGFHNLLMIGAPGSGKTMLAKRIPGIFPPLTKKEQLEVTAIYSVLGENTADFGLVTRRPFIDPHHTVTERALVGGGGNPKPGLISKAHHGILFLDELTEFKRSTLDVLRQPMEEHAVRIAKNNGNYLFPAEFVLVAACNPCPCGYYPDRRKCNCSENEIKRYAGRISGPIRDRMDLTVSVSKMDVNKMQHMKAGESSEMMRENVLRAVKMQQKRFAGQELKYNSRMNAGEIQKYCVLGKEQKAYLENAIAKLELSARSYHKILKVARTIADLEQSESIEIKHLAEAMCYRG